MKKITRVIKFIEKLPNNVESEEVTLIGKNSRYKYVSCKGAFYKENNFVYYFHNNQDFSGAKPFAYNSKKYKYSWFLTSVKKIKKLEMLQGSDLMYITSDTSNITIL